MKRLTYPLLLILLVGTLPLRAEDAKPLRIVCFGDSLTGGRPREAYLDRYVKWSDLLQFAIETQLGIGKVEVLNRGWAGDKVTARPNPDAANSPGAVVRYKADIIEEKPDIAIILVGGNDAAALKKATAESAEAIRKAVHDGLSKIVADCKDAGIRVLLLQYPEPKAADMSAVWTHLDDFNDEIATVAAQQNVRVLELTPAFREAEKTHKLEDLHNPKDGVHLQPYGEIILARAVYEALREYGWIRAH